MNADPTVDAQSPVQSAAPRTLRPLLHYWLVDRDITGTALAEFCGVTSVEVSQWRQPWDSPRRRKPTDAKLAKIIEFTRGQISAADFYPPHLRGEAPAPDPREPLALHAPEGV